MTRRKRAIATIGVVMVTLGGCAGSSTELGTPTTRPLNTSEASAPATTSTPTTVPPTTEMPTAPGRLIMEPGETYFATRFWIPFALTPEDEGWWVRGLEETWGYLEYYGPAGMDQTRPDLGRILDLSFVANATRSDPESIITAFAARDNIEAITALAMTTVGGRDAWFADVVNTDAGQSERSGVRCDDGSPHSAYWDPAPGVSMYTVIDPRDGSTAHLGLAACRTGRIWAIDVDGETIVIIAATTNSEFGALVSFAERLVEGIEFGA